ncbi:hypothetical protein LXL04_014075 [Taraxacum kok-saghyz]
MSSEIGVMTAVDDSREDRSRRRSSAAAEDVVEYEVEDVRDEGRLGKRHRSVFSLLNWDLGLDSTHRGFNRQIDGIPHGLYIHPRDRWYRAWEKFILLWAVYSSFFTPMEFGFFRGLPDNLYFLDIFGQVAFFVDVFLQFFVAYRDPQTYKMIPNRDLIAIRYLKSHFTFDLLACMPWDNIYRASGEKEEVRFLILIRLVRARKVLEFFSKLEKDIRVNYLLSRILKLIIVELYCTHTAACIFYYLATTLPASREEYTWIGSLTLGDYSYSNFREIDLWKRYITSLYFSIITMATVGYGDIHAVNLREMIFVMIYVSFDMVLGAYLIGNITALIVKGSKTERYRDRMKDLLKYIDRNGLGSDISNEIKNHLRLQYDSNYHDSAVIQDLPTSIRAKISETLYKSYIEKVSLFKNCSLEFINHILTRVHEEFFLPGEVIMEQGIVVDQLYFVCHGNLEEVVIREDGSEEIVSVLKPHDSFGDVSIICNIPQSYTVRVRDLCRLLRINKQSFSNILDIFFHDARKILDNLREGKENDAQMKHLVKDIKSHIRMQEAELALRVNSSAYSGDLTQLKSLIRAGADPNRKDYDGRSPLHLAASKGHENITNFLLQQDVQLCYFILLADNYGNTPLFEAIKRGHDKIASLLVNHGALLNIDDSGSFLCLSVAKGDMDLIRRMLSNGIDPNSKDYDFRTPLHVATSQGSYIIAKLLVEAGANVVSKDRWGNTPIDEARLTGNKVLMKLLKEAKSFQSLEIPSCSQEAIVTDKTTQKKCTIYPFQPWGLKDENKYGVVVWVTDTVDELMKTAADHLKFELSDNFCIVTEDGGKILDVNMIIDGQKLYLIGRRTTVEDREDERQRKKAAREADEVGDDEYQLPLDDVRDHGWLGKRRRTVFTLLALDLGMDSTHRGFNGDTVIDGIKGLYIHPQNRWYRIWKNFILLWAVYSSFFTPMEFGFFRGLPNDLYLLDIIGQAAFFIDVFLQFFVAYRDSQTYKLIFNRHLIAIRYLKSHFILDLLACMPWDNIYTATGRKEEVRCLLLIRLVRARKVLEFFSKLEKDIRVNYLLSRILKLIIVELYCTHTAACIFYYLATTLPASREEYTWIGSLKLGDYSYSNFRDIDLWTCYTTSLYFAIVTMATVGYGDIHAVNLREMIFVMFYVSFDMVLGAYLIGNMTALIVKGSNTERYRDRMTDILKYMDKNRLGRDIRNQIKDHLRLQYDSSYSDSAVIQDLPTSIRAKISETLYKSYIEQVSLFKNCSVEFINHIVTRVHEEFFLPGEVIMEQGIVVDQLYFVCHGNLEEVVICEDGSEEIVSNLKPHDSFGDVSIICNIPQSYTVRVRDLCRLLRIDKQSFSNILDIYYHDGRMILSNLLEGKEGDGRMKDMVTDIKVHIGMQEAELALRVNSSAYNGDLSQLKSLIRAGADPSIKDYDGRSPLHLAASKGHENIALYLIQQGVEVNIYDNFGNTPLFEAIKSGHDKVASLLVEKGASLKIDDSGSFLCLSVSRGDIDFIRRILSNGIDPNSKDYDFRTPLHVATSQGSYVIAKLLVEAGANVLSKDRWGNTPLDEARLSGNKILVKLLEEAKSLQLLEFPSGSDELTGKIAVKKCTVYPFNPWELKDKNKYGVVLWVPDTIDELMKTAADYLKLEVSSNFCIVTEDAGKIVDVDMISDGQKLYLIKIL